VIRSNNTGAYIIDPVTNLALLTKGKFERVLGGVFLAQQHRRINHGW